jgi:CheY-like chemotaxis protein
VPLAAWGRHISLFDTNRAEVERLETQTGDTAIGPPFNPVRCPQTKERTIAATTHTPQRADAPVRPLVLLVDERAGVDSLIQRHLESQGYEVVRATHRALALKFGRELHPDLVLVETTSTDALALARELQRRGPFSPPAVLLEAEIDEGALQSARADGAIVVCASEPADLEEIIALVCTALRSARVARKRSFLRVPENAEDGGNSDMLCTLNLVDVLAGFLEPEATRPV